MESSELLKYQNKTVIFQDGVINMCANYSSVKSYV